MVLTVYGYKKKLVDDNFKHTTETIKYIDAS